MILLTKDAGEVEDIRVFSVVTTLENSKTPPKDKKKNLKRTFWV